jgi:hypothetical protein
MILLAGEELARAQLLVLAPWRRKCPVNDGRLPSNIHEVNLVCDPTVSTFALAAGGMRSVPAAPAKGIFCLSLTTRPC